MSVLQTGKMIYRNFGNSGLKISVISVGNMINFKPQTYQQDKKIIEVSLKNGINHFDTAQLYALGEAETQLGKILKDLNVPREEVIISTKVHTAKDFERNSFRTNNKKHIRQSILKSLKRLQMDYVDILYAHMHDHETPLEQIVRAYHEIIEEGLSFYWATSNWSPEVILQTFAICERLNLHKPIGGQDLYNLLSRQNIQVEFQSIFKKFNYGIVAYSPLCGGFLTGKYLNGIPENQLNRVTDQNSAFPADLLKSIFYTPFAVQNTVKKLRQLSAIAQSLGFKLTHLALAWVIKFAYTNSALIGARTVAQLEDSLRAFELIQKLTPELLAKINKIIDTTPKTRYNFLTWTLKEPIRPAASE